MKNGVGSIFRSRPWAAPTLLALGLCACGPQSEDAKAAATDSASGAACPAAVGHRGPSQLRREGRYMVDEQDRIVLLHGVNAVWKLAPYFPPATAEGFTAADADWLRDHGFNTVRLGVIFAGVMPHEGVIDTAYLQSVDRVVQLLASRGIYVLFDFHQDMYNEKFGGEGFPDWAVYDDGVPATNIGFPQTYFTPAVSHTFDNLWRNTNGLWDRYADAWTAVATKWRGQDHHMGFDLMNEPYPGSQFASCANPAGCPAFDTQFLQKMQERSLAGIRTADPGNIVWFEPNFVFNGGAMTHLGVIDWPDDANLGFSWHKYCLLGVVLHSQGQEDLPACEQWQQLVSDEAELVIERLQSTTMVTEFGASDDEADLRQVIDQTAAKFVGWQYWQYKNWRDPTTESQESGGQGLFADDTDLATVKLDKLAILERPYPRATAGVPDAGALSFDATTREFRYAYTPRCAGGPTEIYVPKLHYPGGYAVELDGARATSPPGASVLKLEAVRDAQHVTVRITPQ